MERICFAQSFVIYDHVLSASCPTPLTEENGFRQNYDMQNLEINKENLNDMILRFAESSKNLQKLENPDENFNFSIHRSNSTSSSRAEISRDPEEHQYIENYDYGTDVLAPASSTLLDTSKPVAFLRDVDTIDDFMLDADSKNCNYFGTMVLSCDDFAYQNSVEIAEVNGEYGFYFVEGKEKDKTQGHSLFQINIWYDYNDVLTIFTPRIYKLSEVGASGDFKIQLYGPTQYLKFDDKLEVDENEISYSKNGKVKARKSKKEKRKLRVEKNQKFQTRYIFYL